MIFWPIGWVITMGIVIWHDEEVYTFRYILRMLVTSFVFLGIWPLTLLAFILNRGHHGKGCG